MQQNFPRKDEIQAAQVVVTPLGADDVLDLHIAAHTVYILCGPTSSGKSTFARNLRYLYASIGMTGCVLSSDKYREKLIDKSSVLSRTFDKKHESDTSRTLRYSPEMSAVSGPAFEQLMLDLKISTTYPVNTDCVIVDTTGMSTRFRDEVNKIAKDNGYATVLVTFEYKAHSDYYPEDRSGVKHIISSSVAKFRQEVLPTISNRDYTHRVRIKSRRAFGWELQDTEYKTVSPLWVWAGETIKKSDAELNAEEEVLAAVNICSTYAGIVEQRSVEGEVKPITAWAVISDSHECVEEMKTLLLSLENYRGETLGIVHVGDYLDKGGQTREMVELMYHRWRDKNDVVLVANHEAYVAGRLRGTISPNLALEAEHFTSLTVLQEDPELAKKFLEIYDGSVPFAYIPAGEDADGGLPAIVTHAPCRVRDLGKMSGWALKAQRNYRVMDRTKSFFDEMDWLYQEANYDHPLHIFGHVSHLIGEKTSFYKAVKYKNKVFLDTGCVYGGHLTAVIVKNGRLEGSISIPATKVRREAKLDYNLGVGRPKAREFNINDYELEHRDYQLLNLIQNKGVRYISGTMPPSPADKEAGKLEPIRTALAWYKEQGVTEVMLQPKYMGSRGQLYLFKGAPEKTFLTSRNGWIVKGLEDTHMGDWLLQAYEQNKHLAEELGDVILDGEILPWRALGAELVDRAFLSYQRLIESELETLSWDPIFKSFKDFAPNQDLGERVSEIAKFKEVLAIYAGPGPAVFQPFDILWAENPAPWMTSPSAKWLMINRDNLLFVGLRDEEFEASVVKAQKYFDELTIEKKMEGVVVKPVGPCALPYMKVRSEEYLRLVYGYDYLLGGKYEKLVRQKNIGGKVRLAKQEHALGMELLTAAPEKKAELVVRMISSIKEEQGLDPRL